MKSTAISQYRPYLDWIDSQDLLMRKHLVKLADINSGSLNFKGLESVCHLLKTFFEPLCADQTEISLPPLETINVHGEIEKNQLGNALHFQKRPDADLNVLLLVHMDTVFHTDSQFQSTELINENKLKGPGVADSKGGIIVMLTALQALEQSPWADKIGWEIIVNSDEEIGSPGSAGLIAERAKNKNLGFVYEPALPDNSLVSERKGSGGFTAVVRGKAAHAGRDFHLGRNAVSAVAEFISHIDDLNRQRNGVTINPGFVHGGGPVNIVPDLAILRFNVRTSSEDDEVWLKKKIEDITKRINKKEGLTIQLYGRFYRKPKTLSEKNRQFMEMVEVCGADLGIPIKWHSSGGCCDGNNLAAAGLPNIDTLGVRGGSIHSEDEFICLESLTERARLSALLLMKLASGKFCWEK